MSATSSDPRLPTHGGMQLIGLGLGRTGTGSLRIALNMLGYKTFHMWEVFNDLDRLNAGWTNIYQKAADGTVKRQDWDDLFADYTATTDFPAAMFPRELVAAYPDAKFILTTRDAAKWKASTEATIYQGGTLPILRLAPLLRAPHRKFAEIICPIWATFFRGRFLQDGAAMFEEHGALVKALVPPEQLLVYEVKQGWGPLCAFLGVPVPDEPFPRENEGDEMKVRHDTWVRTMRYELFVDWVMPIVGVLGIGTALALNRQRAEAALQMLQGWAHS